MSHLRYFGEEVQRRGEAKYQHGLRARGEREENIGTMTEDEGELRERLRLKIRQLQSNPYGMMGYVVVAAIVRREALIAVSARENPEESR
jgi:hypothetical protein